MVLREQPLDSTFSVITPENIAFEYRLAGPFRRLPALMLDMCLRVAILVALAFALMWTVGLASTGLAFGTFLILVLVVNWFYGVLFETFNNGQTPGKYLLGLRVLSDNGQPIDGKQATLRNLLQAADMFFPMVALVVAALSRKYQRLGDLVAGTIVVIEERQWLTGVTRLDDPRAIQLAAYLPPNFVVSRSLARTLATYVERRRFFTPPRRREVARHLAIPLLARFGFPPDTSYDLLLSALYYRTFVADRSDDDRHLAEARAQLAANNPFGQQTVGQAGSAAPAYVPPPLPQETLTGAGLGSGK